jgi:rRNA-processing protein FCF1
MALSPVPPGNHPLVLDTNFCLIPLRRNRDVFAELAELGYELILLPEVAGELAKLAQKGSGASTQARQARATLQLLERKGLKTTQGSAAYADSAILAYCRSRRAVAATHDNELRKQLRAAGIPVVTLGRSGALRMEEG